MKIIRVSRIQLALACMAGLLALPPLAQSAPPNPNYRTNNLISDVPGLARRTSPRVVNSWGVAFDTGRFFVAENGVGLITIHNPDGSLQRTVINVPLPAGSTNATAAPTGIALNRGAGFVVTNGNRSARSTLLFATEDGTIGGWSQNISGTNAAIMVDNSGAGAVYKSLVVATNTNGPVIFVANFRAGVIEKYGNNFELLATFTDTNPPVLATGTNAAAALTGFAPFGMRIIQDKLFVTFAKQDDAKHDDVAGPGNGFVDVFNLDGVLVRSFAEGGVLNSPWGLAFAPSHFGRFSGSVLVGNFGDGTINAFNLVTGELLGTLSVADGTPIVIPGLWSVVFPREPAAGRFDFEAANALFTAGINGESNGLIGTITPRNPNIPPVR